MMSPGCTSRCHADGLPSRTRARPGSGWMGRPWETPGDVIGGRGHGTGIVSKAMVTLCRMRHRDHVARWLAAKRHVHQDVLPDVGSIGSPPHLSLPGAAHRRHQEGRRKR
jgi:hypothetical protein